ENLSGVRVVKAFARQGYEQDKFEVDNFLGEKDNYWLQLLPDHEYIVELGYKASGTTYFEMVARSNRFRMPRGDEQREQKYADWGQVHLQDPSVELPITVDKWRYNYYRYWKQWRIFHQGEERGFWILLLHNHLPFVRHPEYDIFLEEQWLFEAVTSVYTQLISLFWNLEREGIDFRMTLSLSPTLMSMLRDPMLQQRYRTHIKEVISFAEREYANSLEKPYRYTIEQLLHRFFLARRIFETYGGDITRALNDFQNQGKLEIITCPATHPILPFYLHYPQAVRAQIRTAIIQYERVFQRRPQGMWLPENAYHPGLDEFLLSEGIRWTVVNSHGLRQGDTRCFYGIEAPVITRSGLCVFGIDDKTKGQVWCKRNGYPGDPRYKEWYRDVVWDADWDYIPDYFKTAGIRRNSGLKYYRVTGKDVPLSRKDYYHPDWAAQAAAEHAAQFVHLREMNAQEFFRNNHRKPVYLSAYDGELFGHWWEEGPYWLELVLKRMLYNQNTVRPITPSEYLSEQHHHQRLNPGITSWGEGDFFATWLETHPDRSNAWIYRHLFRTIDHMIHLASEKKEAAGLEQRALNQAARELMLAQSSDWGFLISTRQASQYSMMRIRRHIYWAEELLQQIQHGRIDRDRLSTLECAHNIFQEEMDFRVFAR
ncbi:MAG: 1,4-alpha-glucan branching protein domain-containing protein, partial [bacterium]